MPLTHVDNRLISMGSGPYLHALIILGNRDNLQHTLSEVVIGVHLVDNLRVIDLVCMRVKTIISVLFG